MYSNIFNQAYDIFNFTLYTPIPFIVESEKKEKPPPSSVKKG